FMAVSMFASGVGAVEMILATFILNFRHFIMGLSLMNGLNAVSNKWKWILSSWITDETFSVASFHKEKASTGFLSGLMLGGLAGLMFGGLLAELGLLGFIFGLFINLLAIVALIAIIARIVAFFKDRKKKEAHSWRG
ncbi:MAG: AzlC family ABC transporter permease, partial [Bacillales bacterium]